MNKRIVSYGFSTLKPVFLNFRMFCVFFKASQTLYIVSKSSKIAPLYISTFFYILTIGCGDLSQGFSKPQTSNKVWPVTWEAKLISLFLQRFVWSEYPLYIVGLELVGILLVASTDCSINSKELNLTSKIMILSSDKLASFNSESEALEGLPSSALALERAYCCAETWQLCYNFLPL